MKLFTYIMKGVRKLYRKLSRKTFYDPICDLNRQSANDKIYQLLKSSEPIMITRYGSTEIGTLLNYIMIKSDKPIISKLWNYIIDNTELPWWDEIHLTPMEEWSGVFPISFDLCERFSKRYIEDSKDIDMLGSFHYTEKFMPLPENSTKVHLETLYPFFVDRPWTRVLEGKKVLVVHPFAETIKGQYLKRTTLFNNVHILPKFDLITFKSVQSIAGEEVPYQDWFEALHYMEKEISKIDFDIAILGCGAYGLPLAAHIKRIGKKAIHMGGGVQLLFGIKGKRWEGGNYKWTYKTPVSLDIDYEQLYNSFWVRASEEERPKSAEKVEGACYW